MSFGGGTTSDVGDPRSGEATYGGTRSTAGAASDMGITVGALQDIMSGGDGGDDGPSPQGDPYDRPPVSLQALVDQARKEQQVLAGQQAQIAQAAQNAIPAFGDPYDRPPMSLEDIVISNNLAAFDATRMGFNNSLLSKFPSTFGAIGGAISNYNRDQMRQALMQGGTPFYRPDGKTIGAVKLGGRMYGDSTLDPNYDDSMAGGDNENAFGPRRIYPLTPEEEAEEEYQSSIPTEYVRPEGGFYPEAGAYARLGLLDTLPDNLLGYMPNFAEQNRAFRMTGATRPELYQDPYNLQGYSLLS